MSLKKSIFEYDNYRNYLRDFYLSSKAEDKKFSFRYFARIAGFKSFSFLNLIMKGKSNISSDSIEALAKAMKLNKEESAFFYHLVLFNQATTGEEKTKHARELMRSRTYKKLFPLNGTHFDYFDKWYYPVIRGMVGLSNFKESPKWIAKRINPPITPPEAEKALRELETLGLVGRDSMGRLIQTTANVATPDEVSGSGIIHYHRAMMRLASESIDSVAREKRDLSTMTLGVSPAMAAKVKEMIQEFRKDVIEMVSRDESPSLIYQLNFHLFPLTETREDEEK